MNHMFQPKLIKLQTEGRPVSVQTNKNSFTLKLGPASICVSEPSQVLYYLECYASKKKLNIELARERRKLANLEALHGLRN